VPHCTLDLDDSENVQSDSNFAHVESSEKTVHGHTYSYKYVVTFQFKVNMFKYLWFDEQIELS
jgi:hypothetical protein